MYKAPPDKKYLTQWERVKRWYKKIQEIENGTDEESDDELRDQVYAFFMNCYHLKDWVKNKSSINPEILFNKDSGFECFKVCADFVNHSKHLNDGKKEPRGDADTDLIKQGVTMNLNTGKTQYNWKVKWCDKELEMSNLAKECMEKWENFLNKEKLI